ncbi:mas-related G-protein coupled receptor member X1-like [Petaurus breviceps papuanus]|uniref:mas-related G-protein coupled receptor member X1-like n=1 Tax=Petaurus breviceps papuanus TaxID=3040969 RepID=UPI0036DD3D15
MAVTPSPRQWQYVYDNGTERSSVWGAQGEFYLNVWMEIVSAVIALVGLGGNSAVLWLLGFRIPRNPFSVYILNLAGADALFLCCSFLITMYAFLSSIYNTLTYAVCIYLEDASYNVGLSLLTAISTERCLAVFFPSWYLHRRYKHTSAVVCAVLWALPGLFWVGDFVLCTQVRVQVYCEAYPSMPITWFIHLTPVFSGSSLMLLLRVQRSSQRQQPPRLHLLVLLMTLVFLLCGLPKGFQDGRLGFSSHFIPYWLPTLLACLKSSAYPFIYFLLGSRRHRRGKEPLRLVLQRTLADEQELEGGRRDSHLSNTRETSF